ncbi:MAG: (deoxy)nucleoside triphosphate pyrophosphohydrolase [Rothia sp. (in: high G+C Gram-positive bacteria)]|uniref:(deoxy)nucleoside triphosphate pyrophosphohydrolase n=1 Tax=Rothia sp. (in: high G+C Gram-positive bacteria) TaxID=1885016 RepID=UPI0026E0A06E|nr:(deoxy)nucleoside triphosphate pyrophosphohydrolase [Rothia sp. (in: high G+C Gram-positive bacteria)]MDO5751203.1 (deoxy)nucleoside triphosphate pyrophosphohydrolase [Rothia sp. (in: high G+C Gram-positive bacteria)]
MTQYPVQVVGAAILDSLTSPTRLLIAQRSAPEALAGLWEFPGGKVEPGESAHEALARELYEELGVTVRIGTELLTDHPQGWVLNDKAAMRVFCTEIIDGEAETLEDHSQLLWMDLSDPEAILEMPWIPADFPIVRALLTHLSS